MADQLLKTVKPSGGDYTSLEACMNANEQDLVSNDKYLDVKIDGDWSGGNDTTVCVIHNYTTDATRYINIYTATASKHLGVLPSSDYYLLATTTRNYCIDIVSNGFVTINGLAIFQNYVDGSGYRGGIRSTGPNTTIKNCLIKGTGSGGSYMYGITLTTGATSSLAYNCIVYGFTGANNTGITSSAGDESLSVYNCTVTNCTSGITSSYNDINVYNTLVADCTTCLDTDFNDLMYSWCDDTSGGTVSNPTTGFINSDTSGWDDVSFVGAEDFHLGASGGADLGPWGNANDYTGTVADLATDIDGDARSAWDIGADEYEVASPSGWSHKIIDVDNANISKVIETSKANITKIMDT